MLCQIYLHEKWKHYGISLLQHRYLCNGITSEDGCSHDTVPSNKEELSCISIVYGAGITDNRVLSFCVPALTASMWHQGLSMVIRASQALQKCAMDKRLQKLQREYMNLFFEAARCAGPTPLEAVKVSLIFNHLGKYVKTKFFK